MPFLKPSQKNVDVYNSVSDGLKRIYKTKLLPLEETYLFHEFHSPLLDDADFDAKPMVLLVGQYSTGKTTFIKFLLEKEFPGIRIGPEPTTDKFIAVLHGEHDNVIPGNALTVDSKKPFRQLQRFGNAFLSRFQCSQTNSPVLENLTIIDTPGILSGEKQRLDRGYEFTGVLEWFAERVDRIILLFDAHKLDISDEFKRSIEKLKRYDEKIRIVLNKADMVDPQQLMRVYGSLMWSLGKVLNTPEVSRVYIGSFWNERLRFDENKKLFEKETNDLFRDIQGLPKNSALRKLNDLIKRARLAKVHALIISSLKRETPSIFFKEGKKREIIKNLSNIYAEIQKTSNISPGDFPDIQEMQKKLETYDFSKFKDLKKNLIENVDKMLSQDISKLMSMIPGEQIEQITNQVGDVKISMFGSESDTPFTFGRGEGVDEGSMDTDRWIPEKDRPRCEEIFAELEPNADNKISGAAARSAMVKSKLPNHVLAKIWKLSDYDKDGLLGIEEFCLANHLINIVKKGHDLPGELPEHLIPPSLRPNVDRNGTSD